MCQAGCQEPSAVLLKILWDKIEPVEITYLYQRLQMSHLDLNKPSKLMITYVFISLK